MSNEGKDNNPKPKRFTPAKKVFDVVRPGKSPASPNSRSVISSHKPQVPDDQFVPSANTRLASDPSKKRPLMDSDKKLEIAPPIEAAEPSVPSGVVAPDQAEPVPDDTPPAVPEEETVPPIGETPKQPQTSPEIPESDFEKELDESSLTDPSPVAEQPKEEPPQAAKPTPEQLAVGQVVTTPSDSPMTQDDVLAETDAPILEHAIVSHHKHHTKLWEWLLIFFLIVLLAVIALNFLLDAEVLTTGLEIPHTDLFQAHNTPTVRSGLHALPGISLLPGMAAIYHKT
jgi:hypothetical protein